MKSRLLPLLLMTPSLFAIAGEYAPKEPIAPPSKKKALSAALDAHPQLNTGSAVSSTFTSTTFFPPTGQGDGGEVGSNHLWVPSPIAGASPVAIVRNPGWLGRVQWREIRVDGRLGGPVMGAFQSGVAYAAQITWAQELAPSNVLQMPSGAYREGRISQSSSSLAPGDAHQAIAPRPIVGQVPASPSIATAPVRLPSAPEQARPSDQPKVASNAVIMGGNGQPIILPDLGGEPEPVVAHKKPTDGMPVGPAPYPNPSAPATTSFGGAMPASASGSPYPNTNSGSPSGNGLPGVGPLAMLAPSVNLGGPGAGANVGATNTNLYYESKNYLARLGLDYVSPKSSYGLGVKADGAALLSKTLAVGANLTFNNINEAVLNGTWMPENTNLKAKLSGSYMWGKQDFNFYSGTAPASLTQASYYFSTQYVVPKEKSDYLHSTGISVWGSKASQVNNPTPVYTVVETASAYNIMRDPLKLATGTLQGQSVDAQVGIAKEVIAKASMGFETLKFPFSDGTQELNKRIYQDYVVQYQPIPEVSLQAGYKMGAAMNNIMLSAAYSQWKLTGFKNNGNNGITGNQGVMVTYTLPLDGNAKTPALGTLMRPELVGNSAFILRDAATRPVQLPQVFMAKVDTTAVTMAASINKANLGPGVTVNQAGEARVEVGVPGGGVITGVTRNGAPFDYASSITKTASGISLKSLALPSATPSGDVYVVSVTDSVGVPYLVNFTTAN